MNILIIGANGFTGRRMLDDLVSCGKYNMTASSLRDDIAPGDGYRFIRADIRRAAEVQALFKEVCPDVVINTSALSVPDFCETHHSEARATNVIAVEHLAHACGLGDVYKRQPASNTAAGSSIFLPILFLTVEANVCIPKRTPLIRSIIMVSPSWKVSNA